MQNNILPTIITVILLSVLFSCTAPIDINTRSAKPVITIVAEFSEELQQQEVRINSSAPYFQNEPNKPISDALVKVKVSDENVYTFKEDEKEKGLYKSITSFQAKANLEYALSIEVDFDKDGELELYEAKTSTPYFLPLDSIRVLNTHILGRSLFSVLLWAKNPPSRDYFLLRYKVNDSLVTTRLVQYGLIDDLIMSGRDPEGIQIEIFADAENKKDFDEEEQRDRIFVEPGDKITLLMANIDLGYFKFIDQSQHAYRGENPFFGGPPSNIITNFNNGAIGYFGVSVSDTTSAVVPVRRE